MLKEPNRGAGRADGPQNEGNWILDGHTRRREGVCEFPVPAENRTIVLYLVCQAFPSRSAVNSVLAKSTKPSELRTPTWDYVEAASLRHKILSRVTFFRHWRHWS